MRTPITRVIAPPDYRHGAPRPGAAGELRAKLALKFALESDETAVMGRQQAEGTARPGYLSLDLRQQANRSPASQVPAGGPGEREPRPELDLAGWWSANSSALKAPEPPASANSEGAARAFTERRHGGRAFAHLWAIAKMGVMVYSTEWAMSFVHANLAGQVSAYGAMCLFAGFGARWRRRFFGPGQLLEPELYEDLGRWLYRLGTVLVLCGGALALA
ncbi:MAG: hypothetical protein ACP5VR_02450 [Acidimicrobiales bacterium]